LLSAIHFSLHTAQQASSVDVASFSPQREKMIDLSKAVKSFLPTVLSTDSSKIRKNTSAYAHCGISWNLSEEVPVYCFIWDCANTRTAPYQKNTVNIRDKGRQNAVQNVL
jgi:hypothetical protein